MQCIRGRVFFEEGAFAPGEVYFDEETIIRLNKLSEEELSAEERETYIIPGLVDIHSHGCFGYDVCEASEEEILKMLEYQRSQGVTSYFPTTMTYPEEKLTEVCKKLAGISKIDGTIKGIYLEGPFISYEKRGAQNPKYIAKPDFDMLVRLQSLANGLIKFVAIAPETEGAMECIEKGKGSFKFSLAHSTADYDTAMKAFSKGATHVTHLYNAMPAYEHRAPGIIGAAMDEETVRVELICDGNHVHPAVIRNTFKQFKDRVILISDSMEGTGLAPGEYSLGGQKVIVENKRATFPNGTLAGSVASLSDCMRNAVKMGVGFEEAILACTKNPALEAGIYNSVGSISVGKRPDMVLVDKSVNIKAVLCNNRKAVAVEQ